MQIGNTPFQNVSFDTKKNVYAKLEQYNFSGSVKARMAYYMITKALSKEKLKLGDTIIEATTGNTGIAFSALAAKLGFKMIAVMPENQSIERIKLMKAYGAKVILTPAKDGPSGAIQKRNTLKKTIANAWTPNQFSNHANIESHMYGLGLEIINNLQSNQLKPDYFVHGVGTGGTLIGVAKAIKKIYPQTKIVAVEPDKAPALSHGKNIEGRHGIQGIGEGFIPKIVDETVIDKVVRVTTEQAINNMTNFVEKSGISIGISSGANISAINRIATQLGSTNSIFVTIFADGIERYLSLLP